jgi:hypothetical protein
MKCINNVVVDSFLSLNVNQDPRIGPGPLLGSAKQGGFGAPRYVNMLHQHALILDDILSDNFIKIEFGKSKNN